MNSKRTAAAVKNIKTETNQSFFSTRRMPSRRGLLKLDVIIGLSHDAARAEDYLRCELVAKWGTALPATRGRHVVPHRVEWEARLFYANDFRVLLKIPVDFFIGGDVDGHFRTRRWRRPYRNRFLKKAAMDFTVSIEQTYSTPGSAD